MNNIKKILYILLSVYIIHLNIADTLDTLEYTESLNASKLIRVSRKTPKQTANRRRTSQIKCNEYIQQITNRIENNKKRRKHPSHAIGGRKTKSGEFPHMGAVGWRAIKGTWKFICGSSLISPKFMLTAAHCSQVSSRYPNVAKTTPEIVRLGDKNIADRISHSGAPYDVQIQRFFKHPKYVSPKKYFDIGIIELKHQVKFNKLIQPACLWTKTDTTQLGRKATLTGWGVIETASIDTSPELQAAEIDILRSSVCDDLLKKSLCNRLWCGMSGNQLCAGKLAGGVDACQGDSGGPLQVKIKLPSDSEGSIHHLIGVTSFGNGCARANTPAVYTRVSSFIDWIEDIVWGRRK